MALSKPVFRFVGKPKDASPQALLAWVRRQMEAAQIAQTLFGLVEEKGAEAVSSQISQVKQALQMVGVVVASPSRLASLLNS